MSRHRHKKQSACLWCSGDSQVSKLDNPQPHGGVGRNNYLAPSLVVDNLPSAILRAVNFGGPEKFALLGRASPSLRVPGGWGWYCPLRYIKFISLLSSFKIFKFYFVGKIAVALSIASIISSMLLLRMNFHPKGSPYLPLKYEVRL